MAMPAPEFTQGKPPDGLYPAPPEMVMVFNRLLVRYFPHLDRSRMVVLARDEVLDTGEGQFTIAATGVNLDPDAAFECIFWFAMETWVLLDERGKEALVFHELMHCGHDEEGRIQLIPHDAGVFTEEVKLYGPWWEDAQKVFKSARNAGESGQH